MRNVLDTAFEFDYSVVDLADNSTTVVNGQCVVRGIFVNTRPSYALPIKDGSTTVFTVPAAVSDGEWIPLGDAHFRTSLVVDPDNADVGSITIIYKKAVNV